MTDDLRRYMALAGPKEHIVNWKHLDECTSVTPIDPWYFYQDTWAARRVLDVRPEWLLDVGSTALLVGILAQVLPVVSVDVRPLPVQLPNLTCRQGTITALPFADDSVPMASSLSVIEHIGLGRYGDELDPHGSERACRELQRVVRHGGHILLSVPIADRPVTLFNAHRLLTRAQVCDWMDGCLVAEEYVIQGDAMTVWCAEFVKLNVTSTARSA
jgi:SAM-dependent methyltransferase